MKPVTQISWELLKHKSKSIKEFSFIEANPDVMENEPENSKLLSFNQKQKGGDQLSKSSTLLASFKSAK